MLTSPFAGGRKGWRQTVNLMDKENEFNVNSKITNKFVNDLMLQLADGIKRILGNGLIAVILYGSFSRGDNQEYSDIDVVTIVDNNADEAYQKIFEFKECLALENNLVISLNVIENSIFKKYVDIEPYYKNIKKDGVFYYGMAG